MLSIEKQVIMLNDKVLNAFVPTVNPVLAKAFYKDTLGLDLISEDKYALEFNANGTKLRITIVRDFKPQAFTVIGWSVDDIASTIDLLNKQKVFCEKFEFLKQDDSGVWIAPGGTKVAWFKDPDGNLLSLSESD
jgi:hypothetical protein